MLLLVDWPAFDQIGCCRGQASVIDHGDLRGRHGGARRKKTCLKERRKKKRFEICTKIGKCFLPDLLADLDAGESDLLAADEEGRFADEELFPMDEERLCFSWRPLDESTEQKEGCNTIITKTNNVLLTRGGRLLAATAGCSISLSLSFGFST
jgi:hypothetical protein